MVIANGEIGENLVPINLASEEIVKITIKDLLLASKENHLVGFKGNGSVIDFVSVTQDMWGFVFG